MYASLLAEKKKKSARINSSNYLCSCVHAWSCGLTCAVLPSLTSESNLSLLALTNSFSAGMSSCTRNSFLVPSIPLSKDLTSCSTLSKDTERAKLKRERTLIIDKQWLYILYVKYIMRCNYVVPLILYVLPSAALSTKRSSVWKEASSGYFSCTIFAMKCNKVCVRSVDLVSNSWKTQESETVRTLWVLLSPLKTDAEID